jgi:3-oxoacyl-[acyl-carrier-protein] synthase II
MDSLTGDGWTLPFFAADTSLLESYVPKRKLRRVDHFARLAALAAFLALEDAGQQMVQGQRTGVVVATGYGASQSTFSFLDTVIEGGDACASPTFFSSSVHNTAAAYVSILTRAAGPSLTISQFDMSVASGLIAARCLLEEEKADIVLFGGVDETCPVLGYCWTRLLARSGAAGLQPFELDRQSALPGEGAVFFVLGRKGSRPAKYGRIIDVALGGSDRIATALSWGIPLVAGLDGHEACGRRYAEHIPPGSRMAAYSHLYGSLPVGPAFDLAAAALALKDGSLYSVPDAAGDYPAWRVIRQAQPLGDSPVGCIKFDQYGNCGIITLRR